MAVLGDEALLGLLLDGRYRIDSRLARGGMATVYRGTDERLDREVAIKIMHQGLGDDEQFRTRFVREARSAAKLNHRAAVSVFDQGTDGDVTFLVMELVSGRTLREIMRGTGPMDPVRAFRILIQVLTALSAAHTAHLIHRDIKPENVLITDDGDVKVADFGLARAVSAATTATGGALIGTVSYLAPEIVVNSGADARSDVYATGAMAFEMLTGVKPHTGDSPIQIAYRHVHEDIDPPSTLRPDLPDYVDAFVLRATARDRELRAADARVLLQQARQVLRALRSDVASDPELAADLWPHAREAGDDTDPGGEPTGPIAAFGGSVAASGEDEATQQVASFRHDADDPDSDGEATVHWSSGPPRDPWADRDVAEDDDPDDPVSAPRRTSSSTRRGRLLLVLALLVALLLGLGAYWYGIGRYVDAPRLDGMSERQAVQAAEEAGFTLDVNAQAFSETIAAGTIISTDPKAGEDVLPGATIQATVSKGKERYEIPDLAGRTPQQAEEILQPLTLRLGETSREYSETVPEGRIISTPDFKVGQQVRKATVVDLVISRGRQPIEVTDYTGQDSAASARALRQAGFSVRSREEFSDDVAKGDIIAQDPKDGTGFRGTRINLVVSQGPENVDVPDVVGKPFDEAEKILEDAGFKVRRIQPLPGDTVRIQMPTTGGQAKVGSTVSVVTSA